MIRLNQNIDLISVCGAGKTSTCKQIAEMTGKKLYLENWENCDDLPKLYRRKIENERTKQKRNPYTYKVQSWFLGQTKLDDNRIFDELIENSELSYIRDGNIAQTFAYFQTAFINNEVSQEEYISFCDMWECSYSTSITKQLETKVVFLDVDPLLVLERIKNRGRDMEQGITLDYLNKLRLSMYQLSKMLGFYCLSLSDESIKTVANKVLEL